MDLKEIAKSELVQDENSEDVLGHALLVPLTSY
jgi:hypothetical protein